MSVASASRPTSTPSHTSASATSSNLVSLIVLPVGARSRMLDYPLAALGPQNKFFGGYGTSGKGCGIGGWSIVR